MYSGTTFRNASGNVIGAHQKIDRVARRHLAKLLPTAYFPTIKQILHFEGKNGPDGVKRKSPAQDEPWHYYDPASTQNKQFLDYIDHHFASLVEQLQAHNTEKAAFEAAWLAHALVDGLTPAHHFPYEEELEKIRGGEGLETRTTIKDKLVMPGETKIETLANNWKMWGTKGLMTTHAAFELGTAMIISPLRLHNALPTPEQLAKAQTKGLVATFQQAATEIALLGMYQRFYRLGWNKKLARETREILAPAIVRTVVIAWYLATKQAESTATNRVGPLRMPPTPTTRGAP